MKFIKDTKGSMLLVILMLAYLVTLFIPYIQLPKVPGVKVDGFQISGWSVLLTNRIFYHGPDLGLPWFVTYGSVVALTVFLVALLGYLLLRNRQKIVAAISLILSTLSALYLLFFLIASGMQDFSFTALGQALSDNLQVLGWGYCLSAVVSLLILTWLFRDFAQNRRKLIL